ncbi:DUF2231 domain-containing protein [Motilibacter deserti]|uniref:DUF2231 domain-containing protein n=1 Tax=Motilibacter deserti TaxID=2714956 RepID=A0ABX0H3I1_9ACTN|nr:DUF2231 domain-containing protein [Motilibacter deserti]NHC16426.1 hypothetical protein [Motilibacter deserti]
MGPTQIDGLPAHPLLVHLVVASVPLAALLVALAAVWPAARRRLGPLPPVVALVALIAVPVTMNAGEWLRDSIQGSLPQPIPAISRHEEVAERLLPWVIALFVVAVAGWALLRRAVVPVALRVVVAVVAVIVSVGSTVAVYQAGDTGARAVWEGVGTSGG